MTKLLIVQEFKGLYCMTRVDAHPRAPACRRCPPPITDRVLFFVFCVLGLID